MGRVGTEQGSCVMLRQVTGEIMPGRNHPDSIGSAPVAGQRPNGMIAPMENLPASLQSLGTGIQHVACLHPPYKIVAQFS